MLQTSSCCCILTLRKVKAVGAAALVTTPPTQVYRLQRRRKISPGLSYIIMAQVPFLSLPHWKHFDGKWQATDNITPAKVTAPWYLGWQAHSVEAPSHLGDFLQGVLLSSGLGSVDGVVVERLTSQIHHLIKRETQRGHASIHSQPVTKNSKLSPCTHLCFRHHSQAELGINQWCGSFREVTLVRQQAASAEATRTAQLIRRTNNSRLHTFCLLTGWKKTRYTLWKYLVHLGFRWPYGSSDFGLKTPIIFWKKEKKKTWWWPGSVMLQWGNTVHLLTRLKNKELISSDRDGGNKVEINAFSL